LDSVSCHPWRISSYGQLGRFSTGLGPHHSGFTPLLFFWRHEPCADRRDWTTRVRRWHLAPRCVWCLGTIHQREVINSLCWEFHKAYSLS
jgi:hypothetical protein